MCATFTVPEKYRPLLGPLETQRAIKFVKDSFERALADKLFLHRVTAPLFVLSGTGINDDLNGREKPIRFTVRGMDHQAVEIVQSLAKWKRLMLAELALPVGQGIYTDMNAVRPDEIPDALHSVYVDQWDWEMVLAREDRRLDFLKKTVRRIYKALLRTEAELQGQFPELTPRLPPDISFIHSEELLQRFPGCKPKEREKLICREHGAVFIIGIGAPLADGQPHDGRAPDYDDWSTPNGNGCGLNGDILLWHPVLHCGLEISSMGIRVDPPTLLRQLKICRASERKGLLFHSRLLAGELPLTIGGGIGQSRICMYLLQKAHIGEVQAGIWPEEERRDFRRRKIHLL